MVEENPLRLHWKRGRQGHKSEEMDLCPLLAGSVWYTLLVQQTPELFRHIDGSCCIHNEWVFQASWSSCSSTLSLNFNGLLRFFEHVLPPKPHLLFINHAVACLPYTL